MAATAGQTIKYGDSNIVDAVRQYWDTELQSKVYAKSISRNLPGAVRIVANYGQGVDQVYRWTRSLGITTTDSTRYDVATSDLEMNVVAYGVEDHTVTALHKAGYVQEKVDILRDQEGFVMPNIMDSLARDLAKSENVAFVSAIDAASTSATSGSAISVVLLRKGPTAIQMADLTPLYIIMNANTVQTVADELLPANTTGDNTFLRENNVGRLHGCDVILSTYVADNTVYTLGENAAVIFERQPYTMTTARDNISVLFVKFAVEARFGIGADRTESIRKSTFTGS